MFRVEDIENKTKEGVLGETADEQLEKKGWIKKLFEKNDSISPKFISREDWEDKGLDNILEDNGDKIKTIYLPDDLHPWEAGIIASIIGKDTYKEGDPKREKAEERMERLGNAFKVSAISLSKLIDDLEIRGSLLRGVKKGKLEEKSKEEVKQELKNLAEKIIKINYAYGQAILKETEKINFDVNIDEIKKQELTEEDQKIADIFFTDGMPAFEEKALPVKYNEKIEKRKRQLKTKGNREEGAELNKEEMVALRKEISSVWLNGLLRKGYKMSDEEMEEKGIKSWETRKDPSKRLQESTKQSYTRMIKTPETEMKASIFRRGGEFLKTGMGFDKLLRVLGDLEAKDKDKLTKTDKDNIIRLNNLKPHIENWQNLEYKKFYEALDIKGKRKILDELREKGDKGEIAKKELKFVDEIQNIIKNISRRDTASSPSEIIYIQHINCVGASFLGSSFLRELGIKCLNSANDSHNWLLVISEDNSLYWRDMLFPYKNKKLSDSNFKEGEGSVKEILEFSKNPKGRSLDLELKNGERFKVNDIEEGLQISVLNNIYFDVENIADKIRANLDIIEIDPKDTYNNLGIAYREGNQIEKAIETYKKAIEINPKNAKTYNNLGIAYYKDNKIKKAIEAWKKATKINPKYINAYYNLSLALAEDGQYDEAEKMMKKYKELS